MSVSGTGGEQATSPPSTTNGDDGRKRKHDDGHSASAGTRAKRNRYISIACNECKRRKIKCNGQTPCQRCGNLSLECVYAPNCCSSSFKDSDEYRQISQHLQSLQDQVNGLFTTIADLQTKPSVPPVTGLAADPNGIVDSQAFAFQATTPRRASEVHQPPPVRTFSGPGSSNFYLDQNGNGLPTDTATDETLSHTKPVLSSSASTVDVRGETTTSNILKDPMWEISLDEALRLCRVYAEQIGSSYPIVDVEKATNKARTMFTFLDSMRRVGLMEDESKRGDSFCGSETLVLKMMLALASTAENYGASNLGQRLFENVRLIVNDQDLLGGSATILGLQLWVLIGLYHYNTGSEMQAYRFIGLAARYSLELGLNRSDIVAEMFDTPDGVRDAIRLFWSIYVCDRRWSYSTGLPYAIRDDDIDANIPMPDDAFPYIKMMTYFAKIAMRIWTSIGAFENTGMLLKTEDMSWLDWQISQWQNQIPEELRFTHLDLEGGSEAIDPHQKRTRVLLYVRSNHLRIMLYRPVLFTVASAMENRGFAQTVVEIAKDSIRTMSEVHKTHQIFGDDKLMFQALLVSALSVLLLAVAQVPVDFSRQVRDEFYLALDLIKQAALKTSIMQRLSRTIRKLKKTVLKAAGLMAGEPTGAIPNGADPHSSAAIAMAGLAGHPIDNATWTQGLATAAKNPDEDQTQLDGPQMSFELSNLFEVACGYGEAMITKHEALLMNGMDAAAAAAPTGAETLATLFRDGDLGQSSGLEFTKALKEIL